MDNRAAERFFSDTEVSVWHNQSLRVPQIEGYFAIREHFNSSDEPCYVQLPVGCGKTGLMGLSPFGIAKGRVLIIAPNLTIRETIRRELNVGDPNCFYSKRGVFVPRNGPYMSELKTGANIHDCDAAHIVVANIQQFSGTRNRWYEALPTDYFDMILVDEGHHNVAGNMDATFCILRQGQSYLVHGDTDARRWAGRFRNSGLSVRLCAVDENGVHFAN